MRCCNCGVNVPPEFVKAIEANTCPACMLPIMTDDSKELMDELASAFARMPNDAQGLAGWLMSNYKFKKIGSAEPTEHFYRAGTGAPAQGQGGIKIAPNVLDEYMSRTDVANKVKQPSPAILAVKNNRGKLAEMAAMVNGMEDPYGMGSGSDISPADTNGPSQADIAEYNALMSQGIDPFAGGQLGQQTPQLSSKASGVLSPAQILAMRRQEQYNPYQEHDQYEDGGRSTVGAGDDVLTPEEQRLMGTAEGQRFVQEQRLKRVKAQDALSGGGAFTRS